MKTTIIAIGKRHDTDLADRIASYEKMLGAHKPGWLLIDSKVDPGDNTDLTRQKESSAILQHIQPPDTVILLDERGQALSSPEFAQKLQNYRNNSVKRLVIVIGGAYGVADSLVQRADFVWSLSKLVFPHQLVRIILIEQLYRAESILAGRSYHHD